MAGPMDASRDLRLGLLALETGAIDRDQLVSAVRSRPRWRGRSRSSLPAGGGCLEAATPARFEGQVEGEPGSGGGGRSAGTPTAVRPDRQDGPEPTATFDHAGRHREADAGEGRADRAGP